MDLEKIINWDLVDDDVVGAYVDDDSISFIKSAPKFEGGADFRYIKRPRKFEDGALYPAKMEECKMVLRYASNYIFYTLDSGLEGFTEEELSFIGEKLPDSLWGE